MGPNSFRIAVCVPRLTWDKEYFHISNEYQREGQFFETFFSFLQQLFNFQFKPIFVRYAWQSLSGKFIIKRDVRKHWFPTSRNRRQICPYLVCSPLRPSTKSGRMCVSSTLSIAVLGVNAYTKSNKIFFNSHIVGQGSLETKNIFTIAMSKWWKSQICLIFMTIFPFDRHFLSFQFEMNFCGICMRNSGVVFFHTTKEFVTKNFFKGHNLDF